MKKVLLFLIAICYSFVTNAETQTITVGDFEYSLTSSSSAVLVSGKDATGDVVIPKTILFDGSSAKVSGIGEGAFKGSAITSVKISNTIHSIPNQAFANCENLVKVDFLGGAVTEIGKSAFTGCVNLTEVNLEGVEEIGEFAFHNCSSLKSITIPSSVKLLGNYSLETGVSGMDITIESSILNGEVDWVSILSGTSINTLTLNYSTIACDRAGINRDHLWKVKKLVLGDEVRTVKWIEGIVEISELVIGKNVEDMTEAHFHEFYTTPSNIGSHVKIDKVTFMNGTNISQDVIRGGSIYCVSQYINTVEYAEGVTEITGGYFENTFENNRGITKIILPSTLEKISANAFQNTKSVVEFDIPSNVTNIGQGAFLNSGISYVKTPKNVTELSNHLYYDCPKLSTLIINEGVTKVGDYLFDPDAINHLEISSTVTEFGKQSRIVSMSYLKDLSDIADVFPDNLDCIIITNTEARADVYREKGYMNVFSMEGLKYSKADVNRDGEINTKDVKKVYEEIMNQ